MHNVNKQPSKAHVTPKLTNTQIELMFAHILRLSHIFNIAKIQMKPELFNSKDELEFRLLWQAALKVESDLSKEFFNNVDAAKIRLWDYLYTQMEGEQGKLIPQSIKDDMVGPGNTIINRIYAHKHLEASLAHGYMKLLLRDRLVQTPLKKALDSAIGNVITDLPTLLEEIHRTDKSLSSIDENPVSSGAPLGWLPQKIGKFPTGIPFIDNFMRGGHAPKEVYGILGAFGSGKTSLAVQLVAAGAKGQQQHASKLNALGDGNTYYPKECYLFHYEATSDEIKVRLWSSQCNIHHEVLEEFEYKDLSSIKNGYNSLKDYEKEYFAHQKREEVQLQGELERIESQTPLLRCNIWTVDMSGAMDNPKRGTGHIPEIRSIIEADLQRKKEEDGREHEVGVVIIDYAGICCSRYLSEHALDRKDVRFLIKDFGWQCREQIAIPLNCPVWVFHQLTGEANKRTHVVQQHLTDSAESKDFAENLTFCFALGTRDQEKGTLLLSCSKARRAKIGHPPTLVMEGEYFRLAESKNFKYDLKTHQFVPRDDFVAPQNNETIKDTGFEDNTDDEVPQYKTYKTEADSAEDVTN